MGSYDSDEKKQFCLSYLDWAQRRFGQNVRGANFLFYLILGGWSTKFRRRFDFLMIWTLARSSPIQISQASRFGLMTTTVDYFLPSRSRYRRQRLLICWRPVLSIRRFTMYTAKLGNAVSTFNKPKMIQLRRLRYPRMLW